MIGRRSVMRLLAGAPFVGKLAAENAALALMQPIPAAPPMASRGLMQGMQDVGQAPTNPALPMVTQEMRRTIFKAALGIKDVNAEYDSLLYTRNRMVLYLDPDLAANKSYSLAAKIVYQRQRNVAVDRRDDTEAGTWERVEKFTAKVLSGGAL